MAADARESEEKLGCRVTEWHDRAGEALRGVLEALHAAARSPRGGPLLVRPDLLAELEEKAQAASRSAASRHLTNLDVIVREYDQALAEYTSQMARLRAELPCSQPAAALSEKSAGADDARVWRIIAALDVRMMAYEGDCSLLAHIASSLKGPTSPQECQAFLAALRLSPFLSDLNAINAAKSLVISPTLS